MAIYGATVIPPRTEISVVDKCLTVPAFHGVSKSSEYQGNEKRSGAAQTFQ